MSQIRACTVQQTREEVYTRLCSMQQAFIFLVEQWHICEELKPRLRSSVAQHGVVLRVDKVVAEKHRTEWCAAASKYRRIRSSNNIEMPGKYDSPRWMEKEFNHKLKLCGKAHFGRARHGETCSGCAWCRAEPKLMNRCRPEEKNTK